MRILTYNCCALPLLSGDISERLKLLAEKIVEMNPELVLLQEVYMRRHLKLLERRLEAWPHRFASRRSLTRFGGGLAVFSKRPFAKADYIQFKEQGSLLRYSFLARLSRKGFFSLAVDDGEKTFHLIATHTIADYRLSVRNGAGSRRDPYPLYQKRQFEQLSAYLKGLGTARPVIVCGDLNTTPRSEILRDFLIRTGLRDSMENEPGPSVISKPYYRIPYNPAPQKRLDYILHRGTATEDFEVLSTRFVLDAPVSLPQRPIRGVTLSDHFGVLAELALKENRVRV